MVSAKETLRQSIISTQLKMKFRSAESDVNGGSMQRLRVDLPMSPIGNLVLAEKGYIAYIDVRGRVPEDLYNHELESHFQDRLVVQHLSLEEYLKALADRQTLETLEWRIRGTGIALVGLHFVRNSPSGDQPEFSWWIMREGLKEQYPNG